MIALAYPARRGRRFAALASCVLFAACAGKGFNVNRDYGRVADCYAAFMSVSMDADDPGLGFSPGRREIQDRVATVSLNRLEPFSAKARQRAGGVKTFTLLAAGWRLKPQNNIGLAASPEAKAAIYQHVLLEAAHCHATLTQWGATMGAVAKSPAAIAPGSPPEIPPPPKP